MSKVRPQWQLQALAAQRRDNEIRRTEELKKVANYFELNTNKSKHHEQWTTKDYYEKAKKDAEQLCEQKLKAIRLEERRKKLENMLYQENLQYQEEIKELTSKPKLYKNGSYLNQVSTSTLREINQGIIEKEQQLRKQEAELKLYHAWRMQQPEWQATKSYIASGKLKSAWTEQIIEKETQKKKEEEDTRKILQERDEQIRQQIQEEKEKLKEKELKVKELRNCLEDQIAELNEKESVVKELRKQEEREKMILEELQALTKEREKEHARLIAERDATIINMGLHKYKLKKKVISVINEIELELKMLEKVRISIMKDYECEQQKSVNYKRVLDIALQELEEYRDRERQRQKNIEAMYDGEARQINEKQDQLWAKEREARCMLMNDVITTLKKQLQEKLEANLLQQKENVLEREKLIEDMDNFHQEVQRKEQDTKLRDTSCFSIRALQSQLNGLQVQAQKLDERAQLDTQIREAFARERRLRADIARAQRRGSAWID
ncbi:trichoplein keratin filament-binding protein [Aricia agestis]|uniref:trichoplein keratin filament-binding protein n=1 Tax=Aricia agestis TaxID=91739 RepID=UPI001C207154|nr:trichoplein keratin filament-binding protein [Aricia agestis]